MTNLDDGPFRGVHRRATLVETGITDHELRGALWRHPHQGRYAWSGTDPEDPGHRIAEAASLLSAGDAIGGWAAAFLQGAKDLDGRGWTNLLEPVQLALSYKHRIRRDGIETIRAPLPDSDLIEIDGVLVTAGERTCFDLMRRADLETAVARVDAMLRANAVTLDAMVAYVDRHSRWNGVPIARAALALADGRAASCPESRLRVVWTVDAGLARPAVNAAVFHPNGWLLGVPDLLDPSTGLAGEYDGAHHRELGRHTADNAREERLESHGLTVVRVTSIDLKYRNRTTVMRLRDGFHRASRRDRRYDRWTLQPPDGPW